MVALFRSLQFKFPGRFRTYLPGEIGVSFLVTFLLVNCDKSDDEATLKRYEYSKSQIKHKIGLVIEPYAEKV
jgi:hypothetical protein